MIDTPTRKELEQSTKTDVQQELPESNPFLRNSFLGAIVKAWALRIYDFYLQLLELLKQAFWDTATGSFLERWAAIFFITRNAATRSSGFIVATGTATSVIPVSSALSDSAGVEYSTQAAATITAQVLSVTLARTGSTVTATSASNHNLASGLSVTIAGANETDYNGAQTITVTGLDTFTYQITTTPSTPATGTITASFTTAHIEVQSTDFGITTNQDNGTELTFNTPIAGVDNTATVDFGELAGGADQENDTDFRARFLSRVQNPIALFNVAAIDAQAKLVAGVTRVFVREITPDVGQITVYFTKDNNVPIIPTAVDVTNVKTSLLLIKPANTADADVIVTAPTAKTINFTFSNLSPNTSDMQEAINANLAVFFTEDTDVGVDMEEDAYRSAIFNTVDSSGARVSSFDLSTPTGDISVATAEIPVLGSVTYP
jgi:uncharacterized phage protein gp47/JayE